MRRRVFGDGGEEWLRGERVEAGRRQRGHGRGPRYPAVQRDLAEAIAAPEPAYSCRSIPLHTCVARRAGPD